jgi:hypothetical protein
MFPRLMGENMKSSSVSEQREKFKEGHENVGVDENSHHFLWYQELCSF